MRDADEAAGHVALEFIARGEISRVRAAETQRHAERCVLPTATSAPISPGGFSERERENIGRDDRERAGVVRSFDERLVIDRSRRRSPDIAAARRKSSR